MKYQLINPININDSTTQRILENRGISKEEITHYFYTSDKDVSNFTLLGEDNLHKAASLLVDCIYHNGRAALIVDADCDGYCSAALLYNYLNQIFPTWTTNHIIPYFHTGKQHGLNDCVDWIIDQNVDLVLCPDAGSNDIETQCKLNDYSVDTIILDHHDINVNNLNESPAIIMNIQDSDYPNKELAGTGVTWQFCKYIDNLLGTNYAHNYLDLVALACVGDMMSLRSIETKHLITQGFKKENIHNDFIQAMWEKNEFKLGANLTPMGTAFYIVPFLNAIVRSGTQEEKELVFKSMLDSSSMIKIPSTKRGHQIGEMETILQQALRTCQNVKARQTRSQDAGLAKLQSKIEEENLLDNKVLLILLEPGEIDKNIAGLVGNKLASQYQRPCCILTKDKNNIYQGSARGYEKTGITDFKAVCEATGVIEYAAGHPNAFGLGIAEAAAADFLQSVNKQLKDITTEAIYYVDFIYYNTNIDTSAVLTIADLGGLWGKDMDEPLIAIEHLKITKQMVQLMSPDKNPTLKINVPSCILSLIKFGSSQEEYEQFLADGYVEVNIVGRCSMNRWQDNITAQILITDYEIVNRTNYFF